MFEIVALQQEFELSANEPKHMFCEYKGKCNYLKLWGHGVGFFRPSLCCQPLQVFVKLQAPQDEKKNLAWNILKGKPGNSK